ncbi:CPBP family intramembrane metalloprotease, partial [Candidatus Micrarchaeota archaeon]|nr:CPBP family intramembrane metalloprotease [Candidatus Micrarchaeota archaeon]
MENNKFLGLVHTGKNEFWRYILSSILIFVFWIILGSVPLVYFLLTSPVENSGTSISIPSVSSLDLDPMLLFILFIFSFFTLLVGLYIALKFVHKRPFQSLITSSKSINWRRILTAFMVFFLLILLFNLLNVILGFSKAEFIFKAQDIPFLLLVLLLIPFQTSAEELLFRSYTMQGLYLQTKNIFLIILLSSLNFAIFHILNPEVSEFSLLVMLFYLITAAFLAFITLKDGSLELALGVHAATNLSILVLNYQG